MSTFESLTMEESSLNHQNGVQMAPQGGSVPNNKQGEEANPKAQYSIPGILHFIQHEWARFELERSQWEVDRAELQVHCLLMKKECEVCKSFISLFNFFLKGQLSMTFLSYLIN